MEAARIGAQGFDSYINLIVPDVAEEMGKSISKHPDLPIIGDGLLLYGAFEGDPPKPTGALVAQTAGTSVMIRSLFVDPAYRGEGVGRMLVDELVFDCLRADDIAEIDMLAMTEGTEQMEVAEFLKSMGFILEEAEECNYSTLLEKILESARLSKASGKGAIALKDVPEKVLRAFGDKLANDVDTFIPLPIFKEEYDTDVSSVVLKNDEINDIILVKKARRGLIISYVRSMDKGTGIFTALAAAMQNAAKKYRPDMPVRIPAVTEEGKKLAEHIVVDAYQSGYVRCYYSMLPLYRIAYGEEGEQEYGNV